MSITIENTSFLQLYYAFLDKLLPKNIIYIYYIENRYIVLPYIKNIWQNLENW